MPLPSTIAQRFDAAKLYQQASKAFADAGSYLLPKPQTWMVTLAGIAQICLRLREYAIVTVDDIEPVWSELRAIPKAVDVLTYALADLNMVMEVEWEVLERSLAESIHAILPPPGNDAYKATDVAFHESFASLLGYQTLLQHNRWLTFLLLLRRSGAFNLANRQVERQVAQTPAEASQEGQPPEQP